MTKAIGLVSGGLDSLIALKLILDQGTDVTALYFTSPFFGKNKDKVKKIVEELGAKFKQVNISREFIDVVRNPEHGYGKNLNPCIDCKIFMLRKAKQIMKRMKADFVFTGEVLGQRPMSQNNNALKLIQKESGLGDYLLRPLSAKILPKTVPEQNKLINKNKLLDIQGRQRKRQLELAKKYKIKDYSTPAGGCLLTNEGYANKLKDLLDHDSDCSVEDIKILKIGRHFRLDDKTKVIIGRNEQDNDQLLQFKKNNDIVLEAKDAVGPVSLLRGAFSKRSLRLASMMTARYSDDINKKVKIAYSFGKNKRKITVPKINKKQLEKYRI